MKLAVTQEKLSHALGSCGRVASLKSGLPILNNIILRTTKNQLIVAATNLELATTTLIGAKIDTQGEIAIPARLINDAISNLPKGVIELELDGTKLHVTGGAFSLTLNGVSPDEFPELPIIDEKSAIQYKISSDEFKQTISQTIFAAGKDQTRPVLTGVFWHSHKGKLFAASSDGYRLAQRQIIDTKSELAAIIPSPSLGEAVRIIRDDISEVSLLFDETQVRIRVGETELTSRLIDGNYPDYRQLIPKLSETSVRINCEPLVRTAKLAGLFARDSGGSITLQADSDKKQLLIKTTASEEGENESILEGDIIGSGQVSLNSRYLLEVLSTISSTSVTLEYSGKLAPIILKPGSDKNYLHIIMPLKS